MVKSYFVSGRLFSAVRAAVVLVLAVLLSTLCSYGRAQSRLDSLIELSKTAPKKQKCVIYNDICWAIRNTDPELALDYGRKALQLAKETGEHFEETRAYSFVGVCHRNLTQYNEAFQYYTEGLEVANQYGFKDQIAYLHIDLGNLYIYHDQFDKASAELIIALETGEALGDSMILAFCYLNLGRVALEKGRYKNSHNYLERALDIRTRIHAAPSMVAVVKKYLGDLYMEEKDYRTALDYYSDAVSDRGDLKDVALIAGVCLNMANCYLRTGQNDSALVYAKRSLVMSREQGSRHSMSQAYRTLGDVYKALGDLPMAVEQYGIVMTYSDTTLGRETQTRLANMEYQLQSLKRDREMELMKKDQQIRNTQLVAGAVSILLLAGLVIVLVKRNRHKERLNRLLEAQRDEIAAKSCEIMTQRDTLERQNKDLDAQRSMLIAQQKEITDSIVYARRIQFAVLPQEDLLRKYFADGFILYRPRDVVSGDFYWMYNDSETFCLVVADCTGHGVPGAFMSMLGISALNEIIIRDRTRSPGEVLDMLREKVKHLLRQNLDDLETPQDGMDAALVIINKQSNILEYAGAFIPLLCIRDHEDISINATRNPIGVYVSEEPFASSSFALQKGDKLYMTSDGYSSQFGGPNNKKLKPSGYKRQVLENCNMPMSDQRNALERFLLEWQGSNEQTDDVLVVGVEI